MGGIKILRFLMKKGEGKSSRNFRYENSENVSLQFLVTVHSTANKNSQIKSIFNYRNEIQKLAAVSYII